MLENLETLLVNKLMLNILSSKEVMLLNITNLTTVGSLSILLYTMFPNIGKFTPEEETILKDGPEKIVLWLIENLIIPLLLKSNLKLLELKLDKSPNTLKNSINNSSKKPLYLRKLKILKNSSLKKEI